MEAQEFEASLGDIGRSCLKNRGKEQHMLVPLS
jgi:hypothetical protein